jgi:hypothetical protein
MSLEGTIRDLGLQEVGQLLSLSRKSGALTVRSALRGATAWLRFVDGAIVDAGGGAPPPAGEATPPAMAGDRPAVEDAVLDILAWREGAFAFLPADPTAGRGAGASRVRIPTDAMLVESARREDAWRRLRDRVPSADAVPSFVDVEPKALPLLHLVPQEWEVLTRVDGERTLRTLARLLQRDVVEVAEIVHGLVGTGLLTVRDASVPFAPAAGATTASNAGAPTPDAVPRDALDGHVASAAADFEPDDLWIPAPGDYAGFPGDPDDAIFDPQRAGLFGAVGMPTPSPSVRRVDAAVPGGTVTAPAHASVASTAPEPSSDEDRHDAAPSAPPAAHDLHAAGDAAARRGDFVTALDCWTRYLRAHERAPDADRVREMIGLAARLEALLSAVARS